MQEENEILNNFYISVINSIPIGAMAVNSESVIASMNPAMERIFGVRAEDFLGLRIQDLFYVLFERQYAQELTDKLQNVLVTKELLSIEIWLNQETGNYKCLTLLVSPLVSFQDIVMGLILMFEDITEFKRFEEERVKAIAAVEAERERTAAIEAMEDGMVLISMDRKITSVNPALEKMTGYEKSEWVGKDAVVLAQKLVKQEDFEKFITSLGTVLKRKFSPCTPYTFVAKDGREIPVISNVSFIKDAEGKPITIVITIKDITELRRVEEQIKASLKEKELLLKEIHHRVKNNLQIISSLLGLQSNYVQDKQTLEALNESRSRIRTMALVHELLYQSEDLARIDFNEYIRGLTNYLLQSADNLNAITLNINVADDVSFNIDTAISCALIINELVSNSLKYAFPPHSPPVEPPLPPLVRGVDGGERVGLSHPRQDEIHIELTEDNNGEFTLIVSDNGVGIPPNLDFRSSESLGLQLVNALVSQLKGTIELDRSHGTAFKIMFRAKNGG